MSGTCISLLSQSSALLSVRRVKVSFFSGANPTWQLALQPEAVGAAVEVTLLSEAFDDKGS